VKRFYPITVHNGCRGYNSRIRNRVSTNQCVRAHGYLCPSRSTGSSLQYYLYWVKITKVMDLCNYLRSSIWCPLFQAWLRLAFMASHLTNPHTYCYLCENPRYDIYFTFNKFNYVTNITDMNEASTCTSWSRSSCLEIFSLLSPAKIIFLALPNEHLLLHKNEKKSRVSYLTNPLARWLLPSNEL
jgi:hypothetical protein